VTDAEKEKFNGARISGALVDKTKNKTFMKVSETVGKDRGLPCIGYRKSRIDWSHDYALEIRIDYPRRKEPVKLEPIPVITRGAPYVAHVEPP
jgi:hypothetical protein